MIFSFHHPQKIRSSSPRSATPLPPKNCRAQLQQAVAQLLRYGALLRRWTSGSCILRPGLAKSRCENAIKKGVILNKKRKGKLVLQCQHVSEKMCFFLGGGKCIFNVGFGRGRVLTFSGCQLENEGESKSKFSLVIQDT